MEREIHRHMRIASTVQVQTLYLFVVVKRELCFKAKLSVNWSVYVPILIYGHKLNSHRKNETVDTCGRNMFSSQGSWTFT